MLIIVPILAILATGSWVGWLGIWGWLGLELLKNIVKDKNDKNNHKIPTSIKKKLKNQANKKLMALIVIILIIASHQFGWWLGIRSLDNFQAESRLRIYTKLGLAFVKKPILGYGWANVTTAFNLVQWPKGLDLKHDVYLDKAHGSLLEVLVTTGAVGLLIYVAILFKSIKELNQHKQYTLLIALILFILHSQTNVTSIAQEAILWTLIGLSGFKTS
jgi:O-antigen ligase